MKIRRKILLIISVIIIIVAFSTNSSVIISSIKYSMNLCYNSVIPSLFPFFVLSEFLVIVLSTTKLNATIHLFLCGLITGFPNGTKNVCTLYNKKYISKESAVKLLYCTANASPAYLVSFIGMCILKSKSIGYVLLISQCLCAAITAISFKAISNEKQCQIKSISITETVCDSITNSVSACLNVCGYIIFSGVLADIVLRYNIPQTISKIIYSIAKIDVLSIIVGLIEITRGVTIISQEKSPSIICLSILIGFSGISILLQCINWCVKSKLPIRPIIIGKILYTLLMPIITYCLLKLIPIRYEQSVNHLSTIVVFIFILFLAIFLYNVFDKLNKRMYNK